MTYVDTAFKPLTALSLCPGIRGIERGVERITGRLHTLAYVEIEAFIIENILAAMETGYLDPAPIWSNLKTFEQFAPWFRGCVDLILGGYPCQPFSNAGNRLGADHPQHLWPYINSIARIIRPRACFFENVAGHLTLGYDVVRRDLQELGYTVKQGIFSASEVGAPHQRKRLFILAVANSDSQQYRGLLLTRLLAYARREREHNSGVGLPESANTHCHGAGADAGNTIGPCSTYESEAQRQERETVERSGGDVAYSEGYGDSGRPGEVRSPDGASGGRLYAEPAHTGELWPARPGEQQNTWEHSRTIEPGLGCTIDGYNYREDLLRAFGNAVVDQTATLAFETLLNEHLNAELL